MTDVTCRVRYTLTMKSDFRHLHLDMFIDRVFAKIPTELVMKRQSSGNTRPNSTEKEAVYFILSQYIYSHALLLYFIYLKKHYRQENETPRNVGATQELSPSIFIQWDFS